MKKTYKLIAALIVNAVMLSQSTNLFAQAAQHLKKDGTPDKRYNAAKPAPSPTTTAQKPVAKNDQTSTAAAPTNAHLKADGTPDKRYQSNSAAPSTSTSPASATIVNGKHLKKDGTPDMRYKENKTPGAAKSNNGKKPNQ